MSREDPGVQPPEPLGSGHRKQVVVTVHGINTSGAWQERVRSVLEPHFSCCAIKYTEYRYLGFPTLALDPATLLVLLVALFLLVRHRHLQGPAFWAILIASPFLSYWRAARIRRGVCKQFKQKLLEARSGSRTHLIGHSLGTFLTGFTLLAFPATRLGRVVFTGAVLPTWFDWSKVARNRQLLALRNEVGGRDWVSQAAFIGYPLIRDLGRCGAVGFKVRGGLVHDLASPYGPCGSCRLPWSVPVHNAPFDRYMHSDHFIARDHAETFWLPFLWGIEPYEFWDFVDRCWVAAEIERVNDRDPELMRLEADLHDLHWNFLGRSLGEEIKLQLGAESDARVEADAVHAVWQNVAAAYAAQIECAGGSDDIVMALHPEVAINLAVRWVLSSRRHTEGGAAV